MSAQLAHLILAKAETQFPTLTPRASLLPCEGVAPVQMRRAITFERAIAAIRTRVPSDRQLTSLPIFLNVGQLLVSHAKTGLKGIKASGGSQ
jgi:hypothetical protein